MPGHHIGKRGKNPQKLTSEDLIEKLQTSKIRWLRKLRQRFHTSPDYATFPWIETSKGDRDIVNQYCKTINEVNKRYMMMLNDVGDRKRGTLFPKSKNEGKDHIHITNQGVLQKDMKN